MDADWGPCSSPQDEWFTRLVQDYQESLLRLCAMLLRDRALAEDAVQDTFLKAYKSAQALRKAENEKSYLCRIAINTCRDLRKSAYFRHTDRRVTPETLPEAASPDRTESTDMALTIAALPQKQKEVLLLYYYQNMTMEEIACTLGVAASSVHRRLRQAISGLRESIGEVNENA